MSFLGQYEHKLDAKDRLTVPSNFRDDLSEGVILLRGLSASVWVFSPEGYERFKQNFVGTTNPLGRKGQMVRHHFASGAFADKVDSAGRIRVPKKLQEHASVSEGDCVVVGADDWFEIWNTEQWAAYEKEMGAEINDIAENLSELD